MFKLNINKEKAQEVVAKVEEIRGKISVDKSNAQNTIEDTRNIRDVFAKKKESTPLPFPTKEEEIHAIQNALANNSNEFILNGYQYKIIDVYGYQEVRIILSHYGWKTKYVIGYANEIYEGNNHNDIYLLQSYMDYCIEHYSNADEYFNQFSHNDMLAAEKCVMDYGWDMECEHGVDPYYIFFEAICYAKNYPIKLEPKKKEE